MHRLRVAALAEAVSPWQSASERLAARLRLDVAFRVVETGLVDAPSVIGWIRPVILLPVAVLTNLAPVQIEAILAHELAHIRRRDYAVNLLQTVAETLLFYHPGVWWVSARVREEREHCCDDVAVEVCGEPSGVCGGPCGARILANRRNRSGGWCGRWVAPRACPQAAARPRRTMNLGPSAGWLSWRWPCCWPPASPFSRLLRLRALEPRQLRLRPPAGDWRIHKTDHFEIYYHPDLDLHAERVGREAERAYEHVSSDLKHNLAFLVPVILFPTTNEFEQSVQAGRFGPLHAGSSADPSRDRILLAMDHPADQWYGLITHEVTHVFGFDIIPGTATPGGSRKVWRSTTRRVGSERSGRASRSGSRQRDPEDERARRRRRQRRASGLWPRARGVRLHRVAMGQAGRAAVHLLASADREHRR